MLEIFSVNTAMCLINFGVSTLYAKSISSTRHGTIGPQAQWSGPDKELVCYSHLEIVNLLTLQL